VQLIAVIALEPYAPPVQLKVLPCLIWESVWLPVKILDSLSVDAGIMSFHVDILCLLLQRNPFAYVTRALVQWSYLNGHIEKITALVAMVLTSVSLFSLNTSDQRSSWFLRALYSRILVIHSQTPLSQLRRNGLQRLLALFYTTSSSRIFHWRACVHSVLQETE
jgi:hypothetical protein